MIPLTVAQIARAVHGRLHGVAPQVVVERVVTDSRDVTSDRPATLFVARRGEHGDGHDHAPAAVAGGAVAVVAERAMPGLPGIVVADSDAALNALAEDVRSRTRATVVAVTGSVGKTTTKDLVAAAAAAAGPTVAARGSYNNEVGVPLTLLSVRADTRVLVAELGARGPGQIAGLARRVRPDIGIVTAVAAVHLELFGDLDTVAATKGELIEALPASGTAVLNADDPRVAAMAARSRAAVLTCSASGDPGADLVASNVELDRLARARFDVRTPWGDTDVRLPVAGRHHVANALLALAAAGAAGAPLPQAAARLAAAAVSGWRGEVVESHGVVVVNDAYNANPTATLAAIEMLGAITAPGRRVAVLGVMAEIGHDHDAEHRRVGAAAASVVDRLVVVGDAAAAIAAGARDAGLDDVIEVAAADGAVDAVGALGRGDAVLVKASRVAGLETVATRLAATAGDGVAS